MLFVLTGSSGAGKTAVLARLAPLVEDLALHDFDEVGVPPDADRRWRQEATEDWVRHALREQANGQDTLVAGRPRWASGSPCRRQRS